MVEGETPRSGLRILYFGMPAAVSAAVLRGLLDDGATIAGVVLPAASVPHLRPDATSPVFPLVPSAVAGVPVMDSASQVDTLGVAWAAALPTLAVDDFNHPDTLAALAAFDPDVACVACFSRRIPNAVLNMPRLGFLNIHPSLLPHYRGPEPLFWQLRDGVTTGVTVHYMDEGLDTGDIAAQATVILPDGTAGPPAERILMLAGMRLLSGVLDDLAQGVVRRWPQPAGGSIYNFPTERDFALSTEWSARRAYNFMRGTANRGLPYLIEIAGATERLAKADHYEPDLELSRPSVRHGREILIRFNPGILYARLSR